MTDKKLQEDASEWLGCFMRDHFPVGLPPKIDEILRDALFSAYLDGVAYGEEVVRTEGRIIQKDKQEIIIARN